MKGPQLPERAYHRFLAENAGIFLQRDQNLPAVISKLRLGADVVTDFVLVENCYSNGAKFHLIEIESPHDPLFTKKGVASQPLLAAVHQVISWKTWLQEHQGEARRLFPTLMHGYNGDAIFSYTIVIGRRVKDPQLLRRRRELAATLGISIRSFDSMADGIAGRQFYDTMWPGSGDLDTDMDDEDFSELTNPFRQALTDVVAYFALLAEPKELARCPTLGRFGFIPRANFGNMLSEVCSGIRRKLSQTHAAPAESHDGVPLTKRYTDTT